MDLEDKLVLMMDMDKVEKLVPIEDGDKKYVVHDTKYPLFRFLLVGQHWCFHV